MARSSVVTQKAITDSLKQLGLGRGDLVIVHSSLSSFGYVEGGAETVVRALLDVLGPNGTLVVPTFSTFFKGGSDQVYDRDRTPSRMGKITEFVRLLPGVTRSRDPVVPLAAIGPLAKDIIDRDFKNYWGRDSSFGRLLELNCWILLVGIAYNSCTMFHVVEGIVGVPYREWEEQQGCIVENNNAATRVFKRYALRPGFNNDFNRIGLKMELRGLVRRKLVGKSTLRMFRARDLYCTSIEHLGKDSGALLRKWDRLPVYGCMRLLDLLFRCFG